MLLKEPSFWLVRGMLVKKPSFWLGRGMLVKEPLFWIGRGRDECSRFTLDRMRRIRMNPHRIYSNYKCSFPSGFRLNADKKS